MISGVIVALSDSQPPLTPDGDEARRWAERELANPAYAAAQPTPLDRVARALGDFFERMFSAEPDAQSGLWLTLAVGLVVVVLIVAAILVWGRPRAIRRGVAPVVELFGDAEARSAAQLRAAAAAAAAAGDWDTAIVLGFRGIARALSERDIVHPAPGTTVHAFARAAGRAFPDSADDLEAAAAAFDDVRYLRRPGGAESYRQVVRTDDTLRAAQPLSAREPVG